MNIQKPGATAVIDPQKEEAGIQPLPDDQKRLRHLISRRHPEYQAFLAHWDFLQQTYDGGRDWFKDNIFAYVKEGPGEYADRVKRAYRFNHTREVVDLLGKYLFKQHITRNETDAPESLKRFWKRATKNGLGINDFARQAARKASVLGRIGIVVDTTQPSIPLLSKADEKKANMQTYAYTVGPRQLLDYAYDEEGNLDWILIEECVRDDADPMTSTGNRRPRYRLWDKQTWRLFEEQQIGRTNKTRIVEVDQAVHGLGEVPVILHDHVISDEEYVSSSLIDEIAYLDRATANYLSNLDAIIQDQTFSQLMMPAQNVLPGDENYNAMLKMGTARMFIYDGGEGSNKPEYISPDPKQAAMIITVINKIISEIYHTVGMAGERTKEDNSMGIDNSSGVAKAYDFERVNALLQAKADSLEVMENKIARLVAKWNGEDALVTDDLVSYPADFDTRSLYDEFDIAARLLLVAAPDAVRQHQMSVMIDKLFPQLAKDIKAKMLTELKDWPIDPIEMAADMAKATAAAAPKDQPAKSPAGQGSVQRGTNKDK